MRAMSVQGWPGSVSSSSGEMAWMALMASPISIRRTRTASKMRPSARLPRDVVLDGFDGVEDVLESTRVAAAHSATASANACVRTLDLRLVTGARSTVTLRMRSRRPSRARSVGPKGPMG